MQRVLPFVLVALVVISGCKPAQKATHAPTAQDGKYSEDLSSLRPKAEGQVEDNTATPDKIKRDPKAYVDAQYTVNKQLDAVLDSIDRLNLNRKSIEGYTIQVYSGTNKDKALSVKKQLTQSAPSINSEVQYEQPNFKVRAGSYYTRLEAQKDFDQIKRFFPAAIVVPGQISIN
jgi:hypothetical protein